MSKKNIIDTVGSSKAWGYVAMGSAALAVVGIAIVVKESMEAKEVAKIKAAADAELASIKNQIAQTGADAESFSGCGGCSSNASGYSNAKGVLNTDKPSELVSSDFRGSSKNNPFASVDSRRKPLVPNSHGQLAKVGYDSVSDCKEAGFRYCKPIVIDGETRIYGDN